MENATFWENMQTLEQSAGTTEGNYNSLVSAASKFNNNFTYRYPGQSHAEVPAEIPGRRHEERPTVNHTHRCPRSLREPNNNNRSRDYEHHFAFMATTVGPNPDLPGDDDGTFHAPRKPVDTPATADEYTSMRMEFDMYKEIKRLARIITKVGDFLKGQHPELLRTMKKMSLFDGTVDSLDPGSEEGSS
jgi:hypothetical protein